MDTASLQRRCSAKSMDSANIFSNGASKAGAAGIKRINGFDATPPNIVLINCDDLGQGDPGCYGNPTLRTPNIDRLADQGARFTDFYASSPLCTPSRASLLTGRYAIRTGLAFPLQPQGQRRLRKASISLGRALSRLGICDTIRENRVDGIPDKEITIAEALKVAGYRTGMVGKWHLGDYSHKPEHHPMRHGFDELFGTPMSNDELPNALYQNETMLEKDIGLDQARLTGLSIREAVRFIEGNTDKQPFFLYLAPHAPHLPLFASKKFKDKSAGGIYGDVVEELDWGVGQVMQCLKDKGLEENTIVIFQSDNGPWYEGHPGQKHRGRKGQSYEGGFQIPMIVRWPVNIPAGSVCRIPAMNIDIFPTLLAAAGLELPNERVIDGKDILGLLTGEQDQTPHDVFYFYHVHDLEGVRVGDWKYYREISHYVWPIPVDKPNTFLGKLYRDDFLGTWPNLYNLATDPGENYDLASRYPEKCDEMEKIMRDWSREIENNPGGWL